MSGNIHPLQHRGETQESGGKGLETGLNQQKLLEHILAYGEHLNIWFWKGEDLNLK